jgi:hypothetical protein
MRNDYWKLDAYVLRFSLVGLVPYLASACHTSSAMWDAVFVFVQLIAVAYSGLGRH